MKKLQAITSIQDRQENVTKSVDKLEALFKALPAFPSTIQTEGGFKEYDMECGTAFAWNLYEAEKTGVTRWFSSYGTIFQEHAHPEQELIFVYEGEFTLHKQGKDIHLKAGMVHINLPNVPHSATFLADTKYITIMYPRPSKDYPHGKP